MEKMPTAKKLSEKVGYGEIEIPNGSTFVETCMIEFAKLHVEAALKEASEKAEAFVRTNGEWTSSNVTAGVNKNSILNSYPLNKIK